MLQLWHFFRSVPLCSLVWIVWPCRCLWGVCDLGSCLLVLPVTYCMILLLLWHSVTKSLVCWWSILQRPWKERQQSRLQGLSYSSEQFQVITKKLLSSLIMLSTLYNNQTCHMLHTTRYMLHASPITSHVVGPLLLLLHATPIALCAVGFFSIDWPMSQCSVGSTAKWQTSRQRSPKVISRFSVSLSFPRTQPSHKKVSRAGFSDQHKQRPPRLCMHSMLGVTPTQNQWMQSSQDLGQLIWLLMHVSWQGNPYHVRWTPSMQWLAICPRLSRHHPWLMPLLFWMHRHLSWSANLSSSAEDLGLMKDTPTLLKTFTKVSGLSFRLKVSLNLL